jgi:hypothetical protein
MLTIVFGQLFLVFVENGKNLLSSYEQVVRVGVARIARIGHGVERTHGQREFIQDVEIRDGIGFPKTTEKFTGKTRQEKQNNSPASLKYSIPGILTGNREETTIGD